MQVTHTIQTQDYGNLTFKAEGPGYSYVWIYNRNRGEWVQIQDQGVCLREPSAKLARVVRHWWRRNHHESSEYGVYKKKRYTQNVIKCK